MIFLALGSNLHSSKGNRFYNINLALSLLEQNNIKIIRKSSFYETPSYPNKKDPKFINIVIEIESNLSPTNLASVIFSVEERLERKRKKKNEPRTCDIDIIDYNSKIIHFKYVNSNFTIPHKELTFRNFVLYPLKEISPKWKHPKTGEFIADIINRLSKSEKMSILKVK